MMKTKKRDPVSLEAATFPTTEWRTTVCASCSNGFSRHDTLLNALIKQKAGESLDSPAR
jgi:hypothetical protein